MLQLPHLVLSVCLAIFAEPFLCGLFAAEPVVVHGTAELPEAIRNLSPNTVLRLAAGEYPGGHTVHGIDGLTIEALDSNNPPVFKGGGSAWHFSRCNRLTLRHLEITEQSGNGLNIDDGGRLDQPVVDVTLEHLRVTRIGPRGNHDGIKCSGVDHLTIKECAVEGWGGQAIDFVGCHHATIRDCRFVGLPGFTATAGIQLKGGTSDVLVEQCLFQQAGQRPVNVGGSTGLRYFRPPSAKYEAARIIVRNNVIEGSSCAAAFVGVDGAEFVENTILYPEKWIFRILQETTEPGFAACRNVTIRENKLVFRRSQIDTDVNIGPGTAPETFRFEGNHWFAEDRPSASQPRLPVVEKNGIYGTDPRNR